jgi:predicted DCC family thiol-disulfide oxidoreductase YuxK
MNFQVFNFRAQVLMLNLPAYNYRSDPLLKNLPDDKPIIVFDGFCTLCSGWANFVLKHDKAATYRLMSAQSPFGRAIYLHYGMDAENYETNLLITKGVVWVKSEGSIQMAVGLGFPWRLVALARVLPLKLRDRLYSWVAKNRFKWFGRRDTCYMPSGEFKKRFIE